MHYANFYGLKPADQIVEPITELGITKHFAIYLGCDVKGTEWIAENKKFLGVRVTTVSEYFNDVMSIARIEKFTGSNIARRIVIQNALRSVGKPYDLIEYNCEHFVTEMLTGKSESKQVKNVVASLFALLIIGLISTD